jgi:SSS family solute:Na+ symporter
MSNLSAVLNSASTLITIDFYKKLIHPESSEAQQVRFGQIGGAVILVAGMTVAWIFSQRPDVPLLLKVQNIFFFIAPPFAVIFCAGLLWRRANTVGAMSTIVLGFAFSAVLNQFTRGVYYHRAILSWIVCVIVMVIASLLTAAPPPEKVDPIIWNPRYAQLPEEERRRYRGIKDFRIWWLLFIGTVLGIYAFFLWFRFQHPVPMFPWSK